MARARLCALADIPDGGARGFDPDGHGQDTMFVVRRGAAVFAYRDECPHHPGAVMPWRRDAYLNADGTRISCHGHGALFLIETGLCVHGPCVGQSLRPVVVTVDAGGDLLLG